MKRKLLLDAMASDPTNAGYYAYLSGKHTANNFSTSSLELDNDDYSSDDIGGGVGGEAAFRRARGGSVRYHSGSVSLIFDSSRSSTSGGSFDLANNTQHFHETIEQSRDDNLGY
jgi:hypothetical protein